MAKLIDFGDCLIDPATIVRVTRGGTSGNALIYFRSKDRWSFSLGGEEETCASCKLGYDAVREILDKLGMIRHDLDPMNNTALKPREEVR